MRERPIGRAVVTGATVIFAAALVLGGCGEAAVSPPPTTSTTTLAPVTTAASTTTSTTVAPTTTSTTLAPTTTTTTQPPPGSAPLELGDTGPRVLALQQRLTALGYWVGTPNGVFGDSTQQAVWALQKVAGLTRDGVVGPLTEAALERGVVPTPRSTSGYVVEVDLADDVIMIARNGTLLWTLNTSTGGGYTYWDGSGWAIAETPTGLFHIYAEIDGLVTDYLGQLWRPKYFYSGFAIHGDSYVPPEPVSHGCVRVSDEAIDWIWADNVMPMGTTVWVYS